MTSNVVLGTCFCPVASEGGKCARNGGSNKPYRKEIVSTTSPDYGIPQCEELCDMDGAVCKAFAYRDEYNTDSANCFLYDYNPDSIQKTNNAGTKIFDNYFCVERSSNRPSFIPIDFDERGGSIEGGKCRNYVDGGLISDRTSVDREEAKGVEECGEQCLAQGSMCRGFEVRLNYANTNCYFNRYTPIFARERTSKKDYTNYRCHAKSCDCEFSFD